MSNDFSSRLRKAIEDKGISASDLSRLSGVGKSDISYYLKGRYVPKQDKCYMLAKALNVDPGWLMIGYEEPETAEHEETVQPQTYEAKILAKGIDRLPKEQREQALAMFKLMFEPKYADLFTKETEE